MATITVNVDDDVEARFRERAFAVFGKRKGALGRAYAEALSQWTAQHENLEFTMQLLREGRDLGWKGYKERGELHDRH
ncbi:MAG: hypothetical protein ABIA93_01515 [Candidatus Woesearchaeota archaeon]